MRPFVVGTSRESLTSPRKLLSLCLMALALALALATALPSGCGSSEEPTALIVRDSLGVQILEFDAAAVPRSTLIADEPDQVVGEGTSPVDVGPLFRVVDAITAGEDRLVLAEASTQELIFADLTTGEVQRAGGSGDGPAEFRSLSTLIHDDGGFIGAFDANRRRYVRLDREGAFVSAESLPDLGHPGTGVRLVGGPAGARYVAVITALPPPEIRGLHRGTAPVVRWEGPSVDTLTLVQGRSTFRSDRTLGGVVFGATTLVASDGRGIWIGDTDVPQATWWTEDDTVGRIVRWRTAGPREVTEDRIEEFLNRYLDEFPGEGQPGIEELRSLLQFSERLPAFGSLLAGPGGEVWIGSPIPPEAEWLEDPWPEQEWLVVDPEVPSVTRTVSPAGVRLLRVAADHVLGVHRDPLGAETVRRYPRVGDGVRWSVPP